MSYSYSDDLKNARELVTFLEKVIKKYPDVEPTRLCDGTEVYASALAEEDASNLEVVAEKSGEMVCVYRYVEYAGRHVYVLQHHVPDVGLVLDEFKRVQPEAHALLVKLVKAWS